MLYSQDFGLGYKDFDKPQRETYRNTFNYLSKMLSGDITMSFKRAVFEVENTYMNGILEYDTFDTAIKYYASIAKEFVDRSDLLYDGTDKENMKKLGSIFMVMTTSERHYLDSGYYLLPDPFTYDFEDFWGDKNWTSMFVTKLLSTHKGNCHSLPYLYKIIADEIQAKCYLSFAPNHTYIKVRSMNPKIGWFNTELTNATFPIDAWIKSSGYVHLDAIKNGIYMDTLSTKQEIAVCIIDLAKGYERLFKSPEDADFILECANTALLYYPNYINAKLLKAETLKQQFENRMKVLDAEYPSEAREDDIANSIFTEMETLYFNIFKMGYRTMPKEMYVQWLADLKDHKEKYLNKNLIHNLNPTSK